MSASIQASTLRLRLGRGRRVRGYFGWHASSSHSVGDSGCSGATSAFKDPFSDAIWMASRRSA